MYKTNMVSSTFESTINNGYISNIFSLLKSSTMEQQQLTKGRLMTHGLLFVFLICYLVYAGLPLWQGTFMIFVLFFYDVMYLSSVVISNMKVQNKLTIEGKRVIITGGSSGIGFSLAKLFVEEGASKVVLVARNENRLKECVSELKKISGRSNEQFISHVAVDLSTEGEVVAEKFHRVGNVDILVNCAGFSTPGEFQDLKLEDFETMMKVNYLGTVYATHAVVPNMIAKRAGHVVFLSSVGGQLGVYGFSAYSPSKYAVRGFAEVLYHELRPYNIGVSLVFPPDTETPGYENENKIKPKLCRMISEQAGLWKVDDVSKIIMSGIKERQFMIGVGSDGYFMNALTSGCAPSSSFLNFWVQLFLSPFLRIYMLFLQNFWTNMTTDEISSRTDA